MYLLRESIAHARKPISADSAANGKGLNFTINSRHKRFSGVIQKSCIPLGLAINSTANTRRETATSHTLVRYTPATATANGTSNKANSVMLPHAFFRNGKSSVSFSDSVFALG